MTTRHADCRCVTLPTDVGFARNAVAPHEAAATPSCTTQHQKNPPVVPIADVRFRARKSSTSGTLGEGRSGDSVRTLRNLFCILIVLSWATGLSPSRPEPLVVVPRIVDADTVDTGTVKIRLNGIDAPEAINAASMHEAKSGVAALRRPVNLKPTATDAHGAANSAGQTGTVATSEPVRSMERMSAAGWFGTVGR